MNETEKQNYIRLQTRKLQKLSDIISFSNILIYDSCTNLRTVSDYDHKSCVLESLNRSLFEAIEEYKTLLIESGELK